MNIRRKNQLERIERKCNDINKKMDLLLSGKKLQAVGKAVDNQEKSE